MWFKNARIYTLKDPLPLPLNELTHNLESLKFQPCSSLDTMRYGFVPPLGGDATDYTHQANGFVMICAKKQEKVIPPQAVKDLLEEKVSQIQKQESRAVGRKERQDLKDEIIFSMLPNAPKKSSLHYAYIDVARGLIICNSSSASNAEDLISKLREAVGSLRAHPIAVKSAPSSIMTSWIAGSYDGGPDDIEIRDACELKACKDGRVIRAKNQDLMSDEIFAHIESGMYVANIDATFNDRINFNIDMDFSIKRLKFSDSVTELSSDRDPETKAQQFDADFYIMTAELRLMIDRLIEVFGGLAGDEQ